MVKFIPVRYSDKDYPPNTNIHPKVQEVTANFFNFLKHKSELQKKLQKKLSPDLLSLHTDPRYNGRKNIFIGSELPDEFPNISNRVSNSPEHCMSDLWYDKNWSIEFARFIVKFTEGIERRKIKVIEIHSPIKTYCDRLDKFIEIYKAFEEVIVKEFPTTIINIENRCNNRHKAKGGLFLLSNTDDIKKLCDLISRHKSKLKIVIDIPQLLSEHQRLSGRLNNPLLSKKEIEKVLSSIRNIAGLISGTHIWGYDINQKRGAHKADFDTYFGNNPELKKCFINEICNLFDDDQKRYFVPEVDDSSKIGSIVTDLIEESKIDKKPRIQFVDPD